MSTHSSPVSIGPSETKAASVSTPLADRTANALGWRFLSRTAAFVLRFAILVILARLVSVAAFGLLNQAMIIVGLVTIVAEIGVASALIQRRGITETHIRITFTLTVGSGLLLTLIVWLAAPVIAVISRTPDLVPILRLISLILLFSPLGATAGALLQRQLAFRRLSGIELVSYAVGYGLVGIMLAARGYGVWALAWACLVEAITRAGLLYMASPHTIRPLFLSIEARQLSHYGAGMTLAKLANYVALTADNFLVGRQLGPLALGLYSRAYQVMTLPMSEFSEVMGGVLFPAYAEIQNESVRLRRAFFASISLSALVVFPVLALLAIAAPELILGVFGPHWSGAILPLQILCLGGTFRTIYSLGDSLARATGAVYAKFACHTIYALSVILGALVGCHWGITGVSLGVVVALAIMYLTMGQLSIRLVKTNWRAFLWLQLPGAVVALCVAGVAFPVILLLRMLHLPPLLTLLGTLLISLPAAITAGLVLPRRCYDTAALEAIRRVQSRCLHYLQSLKQIPGIRGSRTRIRAEIDAFRHITKAGLWEQRRQRQRQRATRQHQRPLIWDCCLCFDSKHQDLVSAIARADIHYHEGAHAVYIPPQTGLETKLGRFVAFYPEDAGYKLLKNRKGPLEANYIGDLRRHAWAQSAIVGTPCDLVPTANLLHDLQIGPRLYDLAQLSAGEDQLTMFVVQHICGQSPTEGEWAEFMRSVEHFTDTNQLAISLPNWKKDTDFRPVDCGGNLLKSIDNRLYYLDFQNFVVRNHGNYVSTLVQEAKGTVHFGDRSVIRGGRYLYQQIPGCSQPGKRDTRLRWDSIKALLDPLDIRLDGRLVLDIGCNAGMMLAEALNAGACWGLGWDRPEIVAHATKLLSALGYTRYQLVGAELTERYPLLPDIPDHLRPLLDHSVLFYLAVHHHIGLIASLLTIPWQVMVYEGAEGESWDTLDKVVQKIDKMCPCRLAASVTIQDGDCKPRPLAILLRRATKGSSEGGPSCVA